MPKEIDESKLNYNKYPGEHVIALDGVVSVGNRTFHLVQNYRDAFDAERLEQRFSAVFDKYDYIVGDWGHEQLRLKGFFSAGRKKMEAENKIDHLEDYIAEYCNYGCAYFVLRRIRSRDIKQEAAYSSERIFEEKSGAAKLDKPRRRRNRRRKKDKAAEKTEQTFEIREKSNPKKTQKKPDKRANPDKTGPTNKPSFVIRERTEN